VPAVTLTSGSDLYYDPYDFDIDADPYPVWKRLRDEAPLYYNKRYDFYALSRFDDVERGLVDWETYRSGKGSILELIRANVELPPGIILFEDPPIHDFHRGLLSRVFTPKKMNAIEPKVREFCARTLDPLIGAGGFDFVADLGAQMPMRTIGYLLGIPESDQEAIRDRLDEGLRLDDGEAPQARVENAGEMFAEYVDWRADHPSDDLMTELLTGQFEDETGTTRRLARQEVLTYVNMIAGAGNETTNRLIGWTGKVLAEHPDQRRELVEDRSLVPNTIEELLRYEAPSPIQARYVARDVEHYGQTVPEGSVMVLLNGSASRDERRYPDADRFDIHRGTGHHLSFGYGLHFCLGAALARLEGRVALDEVVQRFPEWEVDWDRAKMARTSTVRGWESLPVRTA
jgi:cytochrome P450